MLNLELLENICSGIGVEVNINALSRIFKKHRNTIKDQAMALFDHKVINHPIYPFMWLYQEYPLLVIARAELPKTDQIDKFLKEDEHIFGAFYVRDEEYNTLLIEYHKDLFAYAEWRKQIANENKIPPRDIRYPSHSLYFTTKNIIKYQPYSPIYVMEEKFRKDGEMEINGYQMNDLCFEIMKKLLLGEGIRTNENQLAEKLGVHRKTIERRIAMLLKENIIGKPICRFPKFFVLSNQILVYYLLEIKKSQDKIIKAIKTDPHIPLMFETNIGRYNLLLFGAFFSVEEHFEWEERYDLRFPDCIGAMKKIYLSPKMTASIDQQKVSLGIIRHRKETVYGKELLDTITIEEEETA
jgi:hypothetical protein